MASLSLPIFSLDSLVLDLSGQTGEIYSVNPSTLLNHLDSFKILTRKLPSYLGHLPGLSGGGCDCSDVSKYKKSLEKSHILPLVCLLPVFGYSLQTGKEFLALQLPNPFSSKLFLASLVAGI